MFFNNKDIAPYIKLHRYTGYYEKETPTLFFVMDVGDHSMQVLDLLSCRVRTYSLDGRACCLNEDMFLDDIIDPDADREFYDSFYWVPFKGEIHGAFTIVKLRNGEMAVVMDSPNPQYPVTGYLLEPGKDGDTNPYTKLNWTKNGMFFDEFDSDWDIVSLYTNKVV